MVEREEEPCQSEIVGEMYSEVSEMTELQSHMVDSFDDSGVDQERQVVPVKGTLVHEVMDEEVSINLKHVR